MKRLKQRILAGVLAFVMCISTVNVTAFAQENETTSKSQEIIAISEAGSENEASTENIEITDTSVSGNNVEPVEDKPRNKKHKKVANEKVYEGENYNVTFSVTSSWESGYNANVKVENTGMIRYRTGIYHLNMMIKLPIFGMQRFLHMKKVNILLRMPTGIRILLLEEA